jgi:hypothetical protein
MPADAPGGSASEDAVDFASVHRPEPGETLVVPIEAGLLLVVEFNPANAGFTIEGDDFVLILEDGARVVFEGLVSAAQGEDAPTVQIAGISIGADVLIDQALALAGADEAIEAAAGEDGEDEGVADGGGSEYVDSFGDLIAGLIKQGIIGETELGFGLTGSGGSEFLVDTEFLSEGFLLRGGGFSTPDFGSPGVLPPVDLGPSGGGGPAPLPGVAPLPGGGDGPATFSIHKIDIVTNEATGNLQIPDELILYLADGNQGVSLSMAGPGYDGGTDNAYIWAAGTPALSGSDPANTWADHGNDYVRFHIGNGNPFFEGSFVYEVAGGQGATGYGTLGVKNYATTLSGSYWTLTGTGADEVLLGLDGRNQIDGGLGVDIIHGGHDSSGDVLIGGAGDDVIFGGSGNDDLQGGLGDDTFLMSAGFGRDDVDGGTGTDIISLNSVLTSADLSDPDDLSAWLTADQGYIHVTADNTITFNDSANGTIDLGGGNVITFLNIEQIVYTDII